VSPYFVVRKEQWEAVEESIAKLQEDNAKILVISGMGGCGKTQMVSYFVQKYSSRYVSSHLSKSGVDFVYRRFKHIFFIDASSQTSIKNDLRNAIRTLEGHQQDTDEDALFFLAGSPESLLIFDNADDPNVDLVSFFPKSYKGIILITSRLRDLGALATLNHLELGPMSQEEAIETLIKASRRSLPVSDLDTQYMTELVEELGCLALALVQAGVYIFNMGIKQSNDPHSSVFQQYISLFRQGRAELMRKEGTVSLDQYRRSVYSTLDLSYGLLNPLARDFLGLCSQFHYSNISLSMILAAANRSFEDKKTYSKRPESHQQIQARLKALLCSDGRWSELHVRHIIQSLSSFSLVQVALANDTILLRFHPLVHSWAHEMLSAEAVSIYRNMEITIISTSIEAMPFAHLQYILHHIVRVVEETPLSELDTTDAIVFGEFMSDNGMAKMGIGLLEDAVKRLKEVFGPSHSDTADATLVLGEAYLDFGKMKESEDLLAEALEVQRKIRGEQHIQTMKTYLFLLASQVQQGRYEDCLESVVNLQRMFHQNLGERNKDTLFAATLLASTYKSLGQLKEAGDIEERTLKIQGEMLGEKHPDTLRTLNNLAVTNVYKGEERESEIIFTRLLEINLEALGEKHPKVIQSYINLATIYGRLGKLREAEEMQAKVLERMQEMMGWRHPDTILAASNLAFTYLTQKRYEEALELQTKVLETSREVLGEKHPDTIINSANMGGIYMGLGKIERAEEIFVDALKLMEENLGRRHLFTVKISNSLATAYQKLGKLKEAEAMQLDNLDTLRETCGENHRDTVLTSARLAMTYHKLGKLTEAKELGRLFMETGKDICGETNPQYIEMVQSLAEMSIIVADD
jgi:tetratricopeptide (TPR) repeat protein